MAAAEELRVPLAEIEVVLADTGATPDDGMTAGSGTTPRTIPSIRQAAAAVRKLLVDRAAAKWGVPAEELQFRDGKVARPASEELFGYADLVRDPGIAEKLAAQTPTDVDLIPIDQWQILGRPQLAVSGRDIVTGRHQYPSDIKRPGMLYGAVLRSPTYRGKLKSVDVATGAGDGGRRRGQGRRFCRRRGTDFVRRTPGDRSNRKDGAVGRVAAAAERHALRTFARTRGRLAARIRSPTK